MVSASEIKARIHGVNDTKKITDAMYMIASAKLRKALRNYERTKPYFDTLKLKISELFYDISNIQSRYFRTHRKSEGGDRTR